MFCKTCDLRRAYIRLLLRFDQVLKTLDELGKNANMGGLKD